MAKSKQKAFGMILTFAGGLIALLSFFILPYLSQGESYTTGLQVGIGMGNASIWLLLLSALGVLFLSGRILLESYEQITNEEGKTADQEQVKGQFRATYTLAGIGIITLLILAFFLISPIIWPRSEQYNSGFWLTVLAQFIILGGSLATLFALRQEQFNQAPTKHTHVLAESSENTDKESADTEESDQSTTIEDSSVSEESDQNANKESSVLEEPDQIKIEDSPILQEPDPDQPSDRQ